MINRDSGTAVLEPGPMCLTIAPLLPVLDEQGLNADDVAAAHTQLATCAYCQAQRTLYEQLDRVLVRHFAPGAEPITAVAVGQDFPAVRDEWPIIDLETCHWMCHQCAPPRGVVALQWAWLRWRRCSCSR